MILEYILVCLNVRGYCSNISKIHEPSTLASIFLFCYANAVLIVLIDNKGHFKPLLTLISTIASASVRQSVFLELNL